MSAQWGGVGVLGSNDVAARGEEATSQLRERMMISARIEQKLF